MKWIRSPREAFRDILKNWNKKKKKCVFFPHKTQVENISRIFKTVTEISAKTKLPKVM